MKDKISGEERHYIKLNKKLHREVKELQTKYTVAETERRLLERNLASMKFKLAQVLEQNKYLKSKLNLTDDEVKQLLQGLKAWMHSQV